MFTSANKVSQEKTKDLIVRLIVMCNLPFNIVTKESFQKLMKHVYSPFPKLRMTSRGTVTARIANIAQAGHDAVRDLIARTSFVCLSADEWASRKSMTPYLSATAYFVVDHHVEIRLLALVPLEEDSTASSMAGAIEGVLIDYACLEKALSLTTDGAGSMMAITDATTVKDCPDITTLVHSRCLVHLLNLVLKSSSTKTTGVTVEDYLKEHQLGPAGRGLDSMGYVLTKRILEIEVKIGVSEPACALMRQAIKSQELIFGALPEAPGWDVMTAFWSLVADPRVDLAKLGGDELNVLIPMAKYAVGIMGIPVCSVVDERIFSAAALIFTPWRQLLDLKRGSDLLTTRTNEAFEKRSTPSRDQAAVWDAFLSSILKTPYS